MNNPTQTDTAVVVRDETAAIVPANPISERTASQAKIDAVAALTSTAYARASELALTDAEVTALMADFPDSAFLPGAAGKENLIYIEHASLRQRLNEVFRPGQWAIIPRNRWNEEFTTGKGTPGVRVYVEAMLCIRGCFVAEAVGDMSYYPGNESTNYGDAVEGAKSAALRRCAKELGIGLQAWRKEWCEGWWARRRGKPAGKTYDIKSQPEAKKAPTGNVERNQAIPAAAQHPTEAHKTRMLEVVKARPGEEHEELVRDYFVKVGAILDNEALEELPLEYVPVSSEQMNALAAAVQRFEGGDLAELAFPPNKLAAPAAPLKQKGQNYVADAEVEPPQNNESEAWKSIPMPFGKHAGVLMGALDKKYLWGLWANYAVETEYNGKPKKPETIAKDTAFRELLDEIGKHYEFTKKD